VQALRLPEYYAITPEPAADDAAFLLEVERVLEGGVRLLQLRAKRLEPRRLRTLAIAARRLAHRKGAQLLINGPAAFATECDADGVHLSSHDLMRATQRPLSPDRLVAASCHDVDEIRKANAIGIDFGVLGPVAPTASHPATAPLGWAQFAQLCALAAFPLYALGGLRGADVDRARARGAQGIAGISAFFSTGV
jgi:8-oxo-dGTP diphosphatase